MRAPFIKEKTKQEIPYQKQIIQVIISYLCFLRKQFPKGCFVTRKIGTYTLDCIQDVTSRSH
jgi:hypothetical protein